MRFVAEANDKGFPFDKENGTFLLSDWNQSHIYRRIPTYVGEVLNLRLEGEAKLQAWAENLKLGN